MTHTVDLSGAWDFTFERENGYRDAITLPNTTSCAKKGPENPEAAAGHLTDLYKYEGSAWFRRSAVLSCPAGGHAELFLERTRKTSLWIDKTLIGERDSLCCAHVYDVTPFCDGREHELEICVSNTGYPTAGGHLTSPDTQSNWLGVTGKIELRQFGPSYAENIRIQSDVKNRRFLVTFSLAGGAAQEAASVSAAQENRMSPAVQGSVSVSATREARMSPAAQVSICVSAAREGRVFPAEELAVSGTAVSAVISLGEGAALWSEFSPALYEISVTVDGDTVLQKAGLREFAANGDKFCINGKKTFLRGKHDGMIFPRTGYAPTDTDGWLAVMKTAKEYGINHYRFHTCCPPEAAFDAADQLGIYMEPELPFWGSIAAPGQEGYKAEEQDYLIREGLGILASFGNHPSFCMMSMGNELWGDPARINEIMGVLKAFDPRPLYTQGSNNFQFTPCSVPNDDFFVGVRLSTNRLLRGSYAMCDAPLGHVQTDAPNTLTDYDGAILGDKMSPAPGSDGSASAIFKADDSLSAEQTSADTAGSAPSAAEETAGSGKKQTITIQYQTGTREVEVTDSAADFRPDMPIVTHEIGQYETYPDFAQIKKYTGPLKPRNLEIFRERLKEKGLLHLADDYFRASGALAVQCYKEELEAVMRSRALAGCQILDLQDFTGQGTALVGVLDAFMESKGLISAEEWRGFFSECVLLARFASYVCTPGERFCARIQLTDFGAVSHAGETVHWKLGGQSGSLVIPAYENYADVGAVETVIDAKPGSLEFCLWTEGGLKNSYRLNVVKDVPALDTTGCCVRTAGDLTGPFARTAEDAAGPSARTAGDLTASDAASRFLDEEAVSVLRDGGKVLIFAMPDEAGSIEGFYCTDFWNYPMFRGISESQGKPVPVGTMGLLIDSAHPALAGFPCEMHSTPQWYQAVACSRSAILDDVPDKRVIVRTIDNFERNHDLALIYERDLCGGTVVFCGCEFDALAKSAEGRALAASLLDYVRKK